MASGKGYNLGYQSNPVHSPEAGNPLSPTVTHFIDRGFNPCCHSTLTPLPVSHRAVHENLFSKGSTSNHSFHTDPKRTKMLHKCIVRASSHPFYCSLVLTLFRCSPSGLCNKSHHTNQLAQWVPFWSNQPIKSGCVLGSARTTFSPFMFSKPNMVPGAFQMLKKKEKKKRQIEAISERWVLYLGNNRRMWKRRERCRKDSGTFGL